MRVLVTGGAGYIGSHTTLELLEQGFEVIVVDNLVNSKAESLDRVQEITGKSLSFYNVDILDKEALGKVQVATLPPNKVNDTDKKPTSKTATKQPGKKTLDELIEQT